MKTLIIYAHPYEKSYNASLLQQIQKKLKDTNQSHDLLDLYKEKFNPVISLGELALYSRGKGLDPKVDEYQKRITEAEHVIFVFPVWWYDLPAILKGFLDKVLLKDWAYEMSNIGIPKGKLTHIKKAIVIGTMKSPMITQAEYISTEEKKKYSELQVLKSGAGYYIGTTFDAGGYLDAGSRDTHYFLDEEEAQKELDLLENGKSDLVLRMEP